MARYYVNKTAQPNGEHEVHRDGCFWLKLVKRPALLGLLQLIPASCRPREVLLSDGKRLLVVLTGLPHGLEPARREPTPPLTTLNSMVSMGESWFPVISTS